MPFCVIYINAAATASMWRIDSYEIKNGCHAHCVWLCFAECYLTKIYRVANSQLQQTFMLQCHLTFLSLTIWYFWFVLSV